MTENMLNAEDSLVKNQEGKVLYLTLNRPSRGNSLDPILLVKLRQSFEDAQKNPKVNVIVLTGAGDKDFCTGIDVDIARDLTPDGKTNLANVAGDIATLIYQGKPTIVGVNGRAMGMGVVFATAADYRIGMINATMRMPEVNIGAFPGASCIVLMSRVCGSAWTRRILMTGDPFTAEQMVQAKVIDELLYPTEYTERLTAVAKEMARKNTTLVKMIKWTSISAHDLNYMDVVRLESACAEYYRWQDPVQQQTELATKYGIDYELTGNPDALLEEFKNTLKK